MAKGKGGFIGQDGLNAPDSPTGVSGTAGNTQVTVSWTAPSDVGGSAITGYRVQDSTSSHNASTTNTSATITGLTNGTSYTFNVWAINSFGYSAPSDATGSVTPVDPPTRGVFAGGSDAGGSSINTIDYINIKSAGNASDFGDLTIATTCAGMGSSTRGLFALWFEMPVNYITIASTGNASDFGNKTENSRYFAAASNQTRGLIAGGNENFTTYSDRIEYFTIASLGNATDFGNLDLAARYGLAGCSSTTRAIFGGGYDGSYENRIDYVTISSTGDATNFGNLTASTGYLAAFSSNTRGVFSGGSTGSDTNTIQYVTIASTGNASDFGDLTLARSRLSGTSNGITGVNAGGLVSFVYNTIDQVTIASTGNATDFGDLTVARRWLGATSDSHGGLS